MKKSILLPVAAILLSALLLFGASAGLSSVGSAKAQAEHLRIMQTILPGSTEFVYEPYTGEDANIVSVHKGENGFVIETATYGYAGTINMMVGVSNEGTVTGLVVNELHETLGLGANALTDHVFLAQFLNSSGSFAVASNGGEDAFSGATADGTSSATSSSGSASGESVEIDAITGATVTSKAVIRCVNSAVAFVTGADTETGATSWGG